jgi:radical SAM superfamily enzyme YgiQ (UPF0313 family)
MIPMSAPSLDAAEAFPPLGKKIKTLLVWPKIPNSFWAFNGMLELLPEKVVMPPLGLVTVAALCPPEWTLRLVDEAVEDLTDDDLRWADLVMVGGMEVQKAGMQEILARARRLGRRTIVGGPYASSEPGRMLALADHVVVGEPDEVFAEIAADLEAGTAKRHYEITDKPDVTRTPIPRFDLLKLNSYASMSIQFSRGCPFQCEFCDIIILYGRKPRTKLPKQVTAELDALLSLGWMKQVFIVDDNFIGNHQRALELCVELEKWQQAHRFPVMFYTEASMDLARKTALVDAMVKANFFYVFLGIESPSKESLQETKKFQNLAVDPVSCIDLLHEKGLWVTGGFIVGFDSDTEDIFDRQIEFIERTAIPWALLNSLHAMPRTALYERMQKEGRLLSESLHSSGDTNPPNFRTKLAPAVLLRGQAKTLAAIYEPKAFYERAWRSMERWKIRKNQRPARQPSVAGIVAIVARSIWHQGIRSSYRGVYWKYLLRILSHYALNPPKIWMAATIMISGHHFIPYSREVVGKIEREVQRVETLPELVSVSAAE